MLMNAARVQLYTLLFFGLQAEPLTLPDKGFWLTAGICVAISETLLERARSAERTNSPQSLGSGAPLYEQS
jgi:hypothetical protein